MDELVKTFHIDWKLIIAQIVNFAIVLGVLYYFGTKPLMKLMHQRTKKIDQGIKNAEQIEKNIVESEKQKQAEINQGRKQAQTLIAQAEKDSEVLRQNRLAKTKSETEKIIKEAKASIENERRSMLKELKTELGDLILLASNKIVDQTIDKKVHEVLINNVISDLKKAKIK